MKRSILTGLFLFALSASAQNSFRAYVKDNTSYREHALDITHMKLEVRFVPEEGLVKGKVTHSFTVLQQNVDSVFFDAPGITIHRAHLNGQPLTLRKVPSGVWVKPRSAMHWDETGKIVFEYEAKPRKGIYFVGWNVPENPETNAFAVRRQIWTQGQGIDNRHWIPIYDDMNDKFVTETVVTFDERYQVLSNGVLKQKSGNDDHTITWHYAMSKPHAGYLLMLGIGKYGIKKAESKGGVPLNLYYYPEHEDRVEPTYRYSAQLVDFLEEQTGVPYPWESYSQIMVQDFMYGAMENTTATIFGDFFNVDQRAYRDRNYVAVNCHELTHQWFGDCITARDGRDTWLQESYATYFPKLFTRVYMGQDEYDWQRRLEQNAALEAGKKDRNPIRHSQAGTARVYQKGSAVISMLSYVLGNDQWQRALSFYLKKHAYGNVETNDLQQAIQDKLGLDMNWFFEQWILHGGEPEYTIRYADVAMRNGAAETEVTVQQTHLRDEVTGLFRMPVLVEVHYTDGSADTRKQMIEEGTTVIHIPNPGNRRIAYVLFDPNSRILKHTVFKKEFRELKAQVLQAPHMLDRYDALVALREFPAERKLDLLLQVFEAETFHQMKAEIVSQIVNEPEAAATLQTVFRNTQPAPKLAALKNYSGKSTSWKNVFIKALEDSSYEVVQASLEKLCKVYPDEATTFLDRTKGVDGMNNSVQVKWHEMAALYGSEKQVSLDRLNYLAGNLWEFRTRSNAFAALKNLGYCTDATVRNLFDAMLSTNGRLSAPAAQTAEIFAHQSIYKAKFVAYYQSNRWEPWQKEQLKKMMPFL